VPERAQRQPVEWGVATRCRRGETLSGDLAIVKLLPDGALVAAVDGLGHGSEAARAARTAERVVLGSSGRDLVPLFERCHTAMSQTRGAAISLAYVSASESRLTWLGVGNVEGRLLSGDPSVRGVKGSLALFNGVPGHQLPAMEIAALDVSPGDVLMLATDGIAAGFADSLDVWGSAQAITDRIMAKYWRANDDALVVAVRYLGRRP
jgi:phosphoserine phosphatase RsbX